MPDTRVSFYSLVVSDSLSWKRVRIPPVSGFSLNDHPMTSPTLCRDFPLYSPTALQSLLQRERYHLELRRSDVSHGWEAEQAAGVAAECGIARSASIERSRRVMHLGVYYTVLKVRCIVSDHEEGRTSAHSCHIWV